jgi:HEPN domain-containing protein
VASIHKNDLVLMAEAKAEDALLLLQHDRYSSAYYLAGYAVEIGLKAIIAREFKSDTLPDKAFVNRVYIHRLLELVRYAGLEPDLRRRQQQDAQFLARWTVVEAWSEDARYATIARDDATAMVDAVSNAQSGILQWLRAHW